MYVCIKVSTVCVVVCMRDVPTHILYTCSDYMCVGMYVHVCVHMWEGTLLYM